MKFLGSLWHKNVNGFLKYTLFFHFEDTVLLKKKKKKTSFSKFHGHLMSADRVGKTPLFFEIQNARAYT